MYLLEDLKMSLLNFYFVIIYITHKMLKLLKVGLSPSKNICIICLKAFFVLKIFTFLSRLFGHVRKTA